MLSKDKLPDEIKNDLKDLRTYDVAVYGSYVKEKSIRDIDIVVITKIKNKDENLKIWDGIIGKFPQLYDIKIFELMPLTIQISVINNCKVIFGDSLDISEYFYFYRKLWNDQKHRIEENRFESYKDKICAMERWKKLKG
ncbi:MAG: DNA polymerase subunit beta [Candidatus Altiarchaeales archaeon HGW-Altiarchaeales-2]|nr:MAG: DNA polymerase subunit beta [Candidatus Altiarchaeales archaeon HGW-Altiarchaeales-2]